MFLRLLSEKKNPFVFMKWENPPVSSKIGAHSSRAMENFTALFHIKLHFTNYKLMFLQLLSEKKIP